jgi:hypothetical protein
MHRGGGSRRHLRTFALGGLALAALLWAAVYPFGVPPAEVGGLFLAALLAVALVIAAAAVAALLWVGLRRVLGRQQR